MQKKMHGIVWSWSFLLLLLLIIANCILMHWMCLCLEFSFSMLECAIVAAHHLTYSNDVGSYGNESENDLATFVPWKFGEKKDTLTQQKNLVARFQQTSANNWKCHKICLRTLKRNDLWRENCPRIIIVIATKNNVYFLHFIVAHNIGLYFFRMKSVERIITFVIKWLPLQ